MFSLPLLLHYYYDYGLKLGGGRDTRRRRRRSRHSKSVMNPFRRRSKPPHPDGDQSAKYAPPPGPPPPSSSSRYLAQPNPPPAAAPPQSPDNPPPYHDWLSVPLNDNASLPPPPSFAHGSSPANNATYDEAARAHAWCDRFPPYAPAMPSEAVYDATHRGDLTWERPAELRGSLSRTRWTGRGGGGGGGSSSGAWHVETKRACPDAILLPNLVPISPPAGNYFVG